MGNSYSRHNDLPRMVEALAAADEQGPELEARLLFLKGAKLKRHWRRRHAQNALRSGEFTHVILQGHSLDAIERPRELVHYIERFQRVAQAKEVDTVLYATWARHPDSSLYLQGPVHTPMEMQERIDSVYSDIAARTESDLAPVGLAFLEARRRAPDLRLRLSDGSHPTTAGSYLAACVIYGTLTGQSPIGVPYRPPSLSPSQASILQRAASDTLTAARRGYMCGPLQAQKDD